MAAPMSGFGPPDVNARQQSTMPSPDVRHPVRPSWNPAEEARRRAEAEQAALEQFENKRGRRREVPEPTSSISVASIAAMSQAHAEEAEHLSDRHYSTMVPRAICVTGFFIGFAAPAVFLWLNQKGHNELVDGHFHPDDVARRVMAVVLGGAALCMLFGWLWWGVAAALNARRTTRWAVSPWYVPLTYVAVYAAGMGAAISERWLGEQVVYAKACALAFGVVMYFSNLTTYRGTAQALGGTTKYFTRLIVVPWFVAAGVGVFLFFADYLATQALLGAFVLLQLVQGLYGLTMYQAMASVDHASVGTRQLRPDDQEFAKFLKLSR